MFFHLSQSVGSGKTQAVLEYIRDNIDNCYLYVAPTVRLCEEIYARLLIELVDHQDIIKGNQVQRIVEDKNKGAVFPRALEACEHVIAQKSGVVIVTSITFKYLMGKLDDAQKAKFSVFIDEGLPPFEAVNFSPNNHDQFLQYFVQDELGFISPKDDCIEILQHVAYAPKRLAELHLDHLKIKEFMQICEMVVSENFDVYLHTTDKSIMVVGLLSPRQMLPFHSVTLIVAIFEQTLLPILWKQRYDVEFHPFEIEAELYDTHIEKGPSIKISYILNERDTASKENLNSNSQTGKKYERNEKKRVIYAAAETIRKQYPEDNYCWAANNDFLNFGDILSGSQMPPVSAGIDDYKRYDNVVSLVCMNHVPWVKNVLKKIFQLDDDILYELWRLSYTYQTVGRCSLRLRDSDRPINMIVISRRCAEQLAELFIGAEIVGQLTNLPSCREMRKANKPKNPDKPNYDRSDHKAYYKYRTREIAKGKVPLAMKDWYLTIRLVNKPN